MSTGLTFEEQIALCAVAAIATGRHEFKDAKAWQDELVQKVLAACESEDPETRETAQGILRHARDLLSSVRGHPEYQRRVARARQ